MFKLLATCFGIGYLQKGAGTIAALFCCVVWYLLRVDQLHFLLQLILILSILLTGIWSAAKVESEWGHDSNRVVIDEWLGMAVTLFLVPFTWWNFAVGFVLFRAFDIGKPFFIRKLEALPGGWGVMFDDLLAGIYSAVILQVFIKSHLF
ncbi:MAG: phosphatidylglycerophosphatase A [Chitinophagaceae bacterium]|nr:MAG: phosphatidylglycerophosphatase A [Chitinophagaceae bacterium]